MFRKESTGAPAGGETVIAQGVMVEGDFTSNGNVVVEGEVAGSLTTSGDLRVGETARIRAEVKAQNASVAGVVEGNVTVQETLDLAATSKIHGDILTKVLIVASGAAVRGRVSTERDAAEQTEEGVLAQPEEHGEEEPYPAR